MSDTKIKSFWDEEWIEIEFEDSVKKNKYKISNYGRVISYFYNKDGVLLKTSNSNGYKALLNKNKNGKNVRRFIHRLVAEYFLEKPSEDQTMVIHLDNNRTNNYYKNLKWVSPKEKRVHQDKSNPGWQKGLRSYSKLTETQVKLIKRKINDPNRKTRMKIIAKRYGISEMQLYRIKSGENWSSVTPD